MHIAIPPADTGMPRLDPIHAIYLSNLSGLLDEAALTYEYAEALTRPAGAAPGDLKALRAKLRQTRAVAALLDEIDLAEAEAATAPTTPSELAEWRLHHEAVRAERAARPGFYKGERVRRRRMSRQPEPCVRCGKLSKYLVEVALPDGRTGMASRHCARRLAGDGVQCAHPDQLRLFGADERLSIG